MFALVHAQSEREELERRSMKAASPAALSEAACPSGAWSHNDLVLTITLKVLDYGKKENDKPDFHQTWGKCVARAEEEPVSIWGRLASAEVFLI
ncbi:hypothetical protein EYF80_057812 [Liparis tanakae]|uniref:Uncharacterized protein n=1 Tax=Liparis tanakae TaxID=230148 RepID=A0A4Z2ET89_9TELE|nr:hypothetical protein EYF80_057812 [Liparis tanakae]